VNHRRIPLIVVFLLIAVATGCAQSDEELLPGDQAEAEELRELARALVPPESTIAREKDGACEMFRDYPDCRTISFYELDASREARVKSAISVARRNGWAVDPPDIRRGGTRLELSRDGYTAWVRLRDHEGHWEVYCAPLPLSDPDFIEDCTDGLQIQRAGS
jgi:hypothetical protein